MGGPHGGSGPHGTPLRLGMWSRRGRRAPTQRRLRMGGSGKSVARCHRTVLAYWKFESISLQRRVNKLSVPLPIFRATSLASAISRSARNIVESP